ncbi:MAG: AEC family transporter [Candidatus Caldatribacterium sp.]|nr:AEC family transporter [Candidatus Caldatribacterium sp.]
MGQVLGLMFILIGLGFFLRVLGVFPPETAPLLNRFVLYVTFPCLVFRSLQGAELDRRLWGIPPLAYMAISLLFLFSFFLGTRLFRLSPRRAASFAMGAAFGNTAFLGYPFILALLGEKGLPPAIFYDQLGNFLSAYTVGVPFCVFGKTGRFSSRNVVEFLKLPPFSAFLLALALNRLPLPPLLSSVINRLADATIPLTMVAIGLSLSPKNLFKEATLLGSAALLKLFLLPLGAYALTRCVPLPPLFAKVLVLQSATPTLVSSYVFASVYELDTELSSSIICATTLFSLVTLPLWNLLLHP